MRTTRYRRFSHGWGCYPNLYVANNGNNTIEKFTPGGVGSVFASTGLSGPGGLAFDRSGNLYAVNFNSNTIEEFTPGGVGSVFASTGLSSPVFIAIYPGLSSVPEPNGFLLLAIGAATVGLCRRRFT